MLCLCINIERKYKKVKVDFNNTKTFNYTDLHGNMKLPHPFIEFVLKKSGHSKLWLGTVRLL